MLSPTAEAQPRSGKWRRRALRIAAATALIIVGVYVLFRTDNMPVQIFRVYGSAMEPAVPDGQMLVVSKVTKWIDQIQRGDMVTVRVPLTLLDSGLTLTAPPGERTVVIERLIGLPGDTISIHNHMLFINGKRVSEPYIAPEWQATYRMAPYRVPEGDVFLLGDNRNNSEDSHSFFGVPKADIIGTVWFKLGQAH